MFASRAAACPPTPPPPDWAAIAAAHDAAAARWAQGADMWGKRGWATQAEHCARTAAWERIKAEAARQGRALTIAEILDWPTT